MPGETQHETPFVRYITREWMWKQEPPLTTPTQLARYLGIAKQTVFGWWSGQRPQAHVLIEIANKTGLPLRKLLELCDYPVPKDLLINRDELIHAFEAERGRTFSAQEIEEIVRALAS